jgi:hypothetical protein
VVRPPKRIVEIESCLVVEKFVDDNNCHSDTERDACTVVVLSTASA